MHEMSAVEFLWGILNIASLSCEWQRMVRCNFSFDRKRAIASETFVWLPVHKACTNPPDAHGEYIPNLPYPWTDRLEHPPRLLESEGVWDLVWHIPHPSEACFNLPFRNLWFRVQGMVDEPSQRNRQWSMHGICSEADWADRSGIVLKLY